MWTILIIVSVPAALVLAHDVYLFFLAQDTLPRDFGSLKAELQQDRPGGFFNFASFGFLWAYYSPESFRAVMEGLSEDTRSNLRYFLTYKAFYVTGGLALLVYVLAGLLKLAETFRNKRIFRQR